MDDMYTSYVCHSLFSNDQARVETAPKSSHADTVPQQFREPRHYSFPVGEQSDPPLHGRLAPFIIHSALFKTSYPLAAESNIGSVVHSALPQYDCCMAEYFLHKVSVQVSLPERRT